MISFCFLQVILCTKEVNEKTRMLALKLLIKFGYMAQKSQEKKADGILFLYVFNHLVMVLLHFNRSAECVSDYLLTVLAGLAGSTHMVSATLLALARLVYEFHGMYLCIENWHGSTALMLSGQGHAALPVGLVRFDQTTF